MDSATNEVLEIGTPMIDSPLPACISSNLRVLLRGTAWHQAGPEGSPTSPPIGQHVRRAAGKPFERFFRAGGHLPDQRRGQPLGSGAGTYQRAASATKLQTLAVGAIISGEDFTHVYVASTSQCGAAIAPFAQG